MLRLPQELRLKIFNYAGLCKSQQLSLNTNEVWPQTYAVRWPTWLFMAFCYQDPQRPWLFRDELQLFFNLIRVCKSISDEVTHAFYSQNGFTLRINSPSDLTVLQGLRPNTTDSLINLTIHLNTTSCFAVGRCERDSPSSNDQMPHPLGSSNAGQSLLIATWKAVLPKFLDNVPQERLSLHISCDCETLAIARQIAAPLLRRDIALRDCAVRLARWPDPAMKRLSEHTALSAMQRTSSMEPGFQFSKLPRELRLRILRYTDLVTPLCEVEWTPQLGYRACYRVEYCSMSVDDRPMYVDNCSCTTSTHHACRFQNCWRNELAGCFCRLRHGAWSARCQCWSPPTAIFLVSRMFFEDATLIFYESNRFVIVPPDHCQKAAVSSPPRIDADIFLRDAISHAGLQNLRFLEIVFPPFDYDYLRPDEPAYLGWLNCIEQIKDFLPLPVLTLRVCMADHWPNGIGTTRFKVDITAEQARVVVSAYRRLLLPLKQLKGLKRLFLHLAWPFRWRKDIRERLNRSYFDINNEMRPLEQDIEKEIMGANYNSIALGKLATQKSQWLKQVKMTSSLAGSRIPDVDD